MYSGFPSLRLSCSLKASSSSHNARTFSSSLGKLCVEGGGDKQGQGAY